MTRLFRRPLSLALAASLPLGVQELRAQATSPTAAEVPEHVVASDRDFLRGGKEGQPAADQPAQPAPVPPAPSPPSKKRSGKSKKAPTNLSPASTTLPLETSVEEVRALLTDYLQAGQSADLKRQLSFFADRVDYFSHGVVNRSFIRQDTLDYNLRWPVRNYQLRPDIQVRPGTQPGLVQVNFTLTFNVRTQDKSARGITFNTALLRKENGRLKIVTLKERLLNRKR